MIKIKSRQEIDKMRAAGKILAETFLALKEHIKPGITTYELDSIAKNFIKSNNALCSFKNYSGYPANICTSVNEQVVHGIPSKNTVLSDGDIISVDIGVLYQGFHADSAKTFAVGAISDEAQRLIDVTKESFYRGLLKATTDNRIGDISAAIQSYVEENGYSVVRKLVGHGVGSALHEDPEVPNFGAPGRGVRLLPGMTLAIEPMVNAGGHGVRVLKDGWTVVTQDGSLSAHCENSIAVTDGDPIILTDVDVS